MLKGGSPLNPRGERSKIPQIAQSPQNGRSAVGNGVAVGVHALLLDNALADPRRDQQSGHATTQTVEFERVVATCRHLLGVGEVVRARGEWRGNVVVETAGLIEGQDEQGLVPLRARAEGLVDVLNEGFAVGDKTSGVHGVGPDVAAGRINEGELGELAGIGGLEELLQGLGLVGVAAGERPVEEIGVDHLGRRVVVHPRVAVVGQLLEDRLLLQPVHGRLECFVIIAVARSSTRQQSSAVRVGGLHSALAERWPVRRRVYVVYSLQERPSASG